MYAKLFASILDSSVWLEPLPTRIVWLTLLAAKDADGFARFACIENLAQRARVTMPDAEVAVERLESPDPKSSNPAHEGRRIERVPGGWMVLNSSFYDDMVRREDERRATRDRVRRHRERKGDVPPPSTESPQSPPKPERSNGKKSPETTALLAIAELREAVWTAGYDGTRKISWEKVSEHHRERVRDAFLASGWTLEEFDAGKDFGNSKKFCAVYSAQ